MARRLSPASAAVACPLFQLPAGRIQGEIRKVRADVTAEVTLACIEEHAVQIKRKMLCTGN